MGLPTEENFDNWFNDQFESDLNKKQKLKTITKYNKLSIKTKIKRLENDLQNKINGLKQKFVYDLSIINKGGHPEYGFEDDYNTFGLTDTAFNHSLKMRNKKLRKQGIKIAV